MIPFFMTLKVRGESWFCPFVLWLPLFLLWIVLLPVALLLAPFFCIVCWACGLSPWRSLCLIWNVLAAARGLRVEVRESEYDVYLAIQ
jgi:hypothetical protein